MTTYEIIGANIRKRRLEKGLLQKELGTLSHTDKGCISKYENGVVGTSIPQLQKICRALECRITDLIEGIETT